MKFDALVKQLDTVGLEELRRTVAIEIEDRGGERQNAPAMDSIRPGMSAQEKQMAIEEISRVLRER